jgi:hypothetical protein
MSLKGVEYLTKEANPDFIITIVCRCYAIVYPLKAKSVCTVSKAKIVLAFVWAGAFILATPTIFIQVRPEVKT